ncbi:MAG: hypothetical protein R2787_13680 [Saprospiraceae bacterium]
MRQLLICFLIGVSGWTLTAQEICDNGIDDDGNGLIDLQDPACECHGIYIPVDVTDKIPNPSFENFNCCPNGPAQMNCAKGWIQATSGTSDYFHTCGYLFVPMVAAGLVPFPDGEGCSGTIYSDSWKEYIAACLSSPLLAGKEYELTLQIASTPITATGDICNNGVIYYPDVEVTFFGSANCISSPLSTYDCPSVIDPGWQVIGSAVYSPADQWGELTLTLTPSITVNALMIGPPCVLPPNYGSGAPCYPYFYYDDLHLQENQPIDPPEIVLTGQPCDGDLVLSAYINHSGGEWQWYLDGVALPGETGDGLNVSLFNYPSGTYTVRYLFDGDCVTSEIDVEVIVIEPTFEDLLICQGDTAVCAGQIFVEAGAWPVNLTSWQGCDSVVYCVVDLYDGGGVTTLTVDTCGPVSLQVCGQIIDSTGHYEVHCQGSQGCDSIVMVEATILQPALAIQPPPILDCAFGASVPLEAVPGSGPGSAILWTGPSGGIAGPVDSLIVQASLPGQYCATLTQMAGTASCTIEVCVDVLQDTVPPANPQFPAVSPVCMGDSVILQAWPIDPGDSLVWSDPGVSWLSDTSFWWSGVTSGENAMCLWARNACTVSDTVCQVVYVLKPDTTMVSLATCDNLLVGLDTLYLTNLAGCDSLVVRNTFYTGQFVDQAWVTLCGQGQSYQDTTLLTGGPCDSLLITSYNYQPPDTTWRVETTCDPQAAGWSSTLLANQWGCDSLVLTEVQLLPTDTVLLTALTCDAAQAGTTATEWVNQWGCDSLVVTETVYVGSDTQYVQIQTCDPAQAGTTTEVQAGMYCDSVVVTETTWVAAILTRDTLVDCDQTSSTLDTMTFTASGGCDSLVITLREGGSFVPEVESLAETCAGDGDGQILVAATGGGLPPFQYRLDQGPWQSGPVFPDLPPGMYSVEVEDSRGCRKTVTGVTVASGQVVIVDAGPDRTVLSGDLVALSAQSVPPAVQWLWTATDVLDCLTCPQTTLGPVTVTQSVLLTAITAQGCVGTDLLTITLGGKPDDP